MGCYKSKLMGDAEEPNVTSLKAFVKQRKVLALMRIRKRVCFAVRALRTQS